ncbi:hypothetical protein HDA30_001599 [Micrococcus cohnii]|uniref:Uncharacterized protein n=1 Tax=Micrococcus cohnii TaxID=993416 RepID=A0A7W7GQ06_9MICC|nr:hypothetical protein [Micrococcus cohnii]MBB4736091.1 hypothetical protein [Micrococcus cohnii]
MTATALSVTEPRRTESRRAQSDRRDTPQQPVGTHPGVLWTAHAVGFSIMIVTMVALTQFTSLTELWCWVVAVPAGICAMLLTGSVMDPLVNRLRS